MVTFLFVAALAILVFLCFTGPGGVIGAPSSLNRSPRRQHFLGSFFAERTTRGEDQ
jgi:hypothetical protein